MNIHSNLIPFIATLQLNEFDKHELVSRIVQDQIDRSKINSKFTTTMKEDGTLILRGSRNPLVEPQHKEFYEVSIPHTMIKREELKLEKQYFRTWLRHQELDGLIVQGEQKDGTIQTWMRRNARSYNGEKFDKCVEDLQKMKWIFHTVNKGHRWGFTFVEIVEPEEKEQKPPEEEEICFEQEPTKEEEICFEQEPTKGEEICFEQDPYKGRKPPFLPCTKTKYVYLGEPLILSRWGNLYAHAPYKMVGKVCGAPTKKGTPCRRWCKKKHCATHTKEKSKQEKEAKDKLEKIAEVYYNNSCLQRHEELIEEIEKAQLVLSDEYDRLRDKAETNAEKYRRSGSTEDFDKFVTANTDYQSLLDLFLI